jgi:hypothetical protein
MPAGDPIAMCPRCDKIIYVYWTDFGMEPKMCSNCLTSLDSPLYYSEWKNLFSWNIEPIEESINTSPKYEKTLVVNLLGGPGTGKSSVRGGLFSKLKFLGIDCEEAPEFAKDLTWEKRCLALSNQIYVFGKQHMRIWRNLGQVEVIITDSPLILTPIYNQRNSKTLSNLVIEEINSMWNYNVFLKRQKEYNPNGRNQSEEQAREVDKKILDFMDDNKLPYETFDGAEDAIPLIARKILMLLGKPLPSFTKKQISEALEL